jgi:hypothetical protein
VIFRCWINSAGLGVQPIPGEPASQPSSLLRHSLNGHDGLGLRGQRNYERRKALVEPVFGVLKQQRGMRQFRTRGQVKVAAEFTLAAIAYNVTRLFAQSRNL